VSVDGVGEAGAAFPTERLLGVTAFFDGAEPALPVFTVDFLLAAEPCLAASLLATVFFAAFFATLLPAALLGAVFAAGFAVFLPATAFFATFLLAGCGFSAGFFLVEPVRAGALRAADFFAADLRVVAMRAYSSGERVAIIAKYV
jgi:hypothetical protein